MTLRTQNCGNYGIFLIMGTARFKSSTVSVVSKRKVRSLRSRSRVLEAQGCYCLRIYEYCFLGFRVEGFRVYGLGSGLGLLLS